MFDTALLVAIGLIVLGTIVSAFLSGRSRDRCHGQIPMTDFLRVSGTPAACLFLLRNFLSSDYVSIVSNPFCTAYLMSSA